MVAFSGPFTLCAPSATKKNMLNLANAFRVVGPSFVIAGVLASTASADFIGYDALVARLGGVGVPDGTGVNAVQVEAPSGGQYGPDQSNPQFSTVTFTAMSGAPGNSGHATTVALNFYGDSSSFTKGINNVWLYEAGNFGTAGYLRTGQGAAAVPLLPPGGARVFNNSWIGSFGSIANDNDANRRADFAMNRDDTLFIVGLNNGAGVPPQLLSYIYNGISVGRSDGIHSFGNVPAGYDGAGRMKPEMVAPGGATSWAVPFVSSVAAMLYQTAMTPPYNANANAREGVVIKSAMMAGGSHRSTWTNNPQTAGVNRGVATKPLDVIYGADEVNVNNAHWILTSGEQEGTTTVPSNSTVAPRGWDFRLMSAGTTFYYRFRVTLPVTDVSILATWHRAFGTSINIGTAANIDLRLFKVMPGSTTLMPLIGDDGLGIFNVGNVASLSTVDNVEHLFLHDLAAGDYVVEMKRIDGLAAAVQTSLAWIMPETPPITGDLTNDGIVDGTDLAIVLGSWGTAGPGDLNSDGTVDGLDLAILLGNWTL